MVIQFNYSPFFYSLPYNPFAASGLKRAPPKADKSPGASTLIERKQKDKALLSFLAPRRALFD